MDVTVAWFMVGVALAVILTATYRAIRDVYFNNREIISNDGLAVFNCCNHCFFENGQLSHPKEMIDRHTVPCNERPCSQNLREF